MTDTPARPRGVDLITAEHLHLLAEEGFWDHMVAVAGPDECWEWRRGVSKIGYGCIDVFTPGTSRTSVKMYAHRAAWGIHHARVPERDVEIDHLCHNRTCCNPRHLDAVDRLLNMRRVRGLQKPRPRTAKDGTTTWGIRYYDYSTGRRRYLSKSFDTEEAALEAARAIKDDRKGLAATT